MKTAFDLMITYLKTPEKVTCKTQEDSLKTVDKVLKPTSAKKVKFK